MASAVAALVAASVVARHEQNATAAGDDLRPVLVAAAPLEPGESIGPGQLVVRQIPAEFVAPEALSAPAAAIGLRARVPIPAGAYLTPGQLGKPKSPARRPQPRGTPVEIGVAGAGALRGLVGGRVDVLVTTDSPHGLGGSTRIAVPAARLLELRRGGTDTEWTATLAVGRDAALRLIEAGSYARELRLIASGR